MFRYTIITLIILSIVLQPIQVFAATTKPVKATLLKLEEATQLGINVDADVANARKNVSQKRTEWKQALQAIMSEAQKDASSFARPHSLSKDLTIRMKLPEARKSLIEAQENLIQQQHIATEKIRTLYISTIGSMNSVADAEKKLSNAINMIKEVKTMAKLNKAKQSNIDEAEDARKEAESALKQAKLTYKSVLLELSKAIGRDVEQGYVFEIQPIYADLQIDTIWKLIGFAQKNNTSLSTARMNRSIADEKVNVTRQLYETKFGSADMKIINSMFSKDINEELFEANYEAFLARVNKQWDGFNEFLIPLPKSLFQGEFDGIRYFDDQRYSLPVSLFELDKARKKEQESLEQLLTNVKTSYLSVKTAEETYAQALQALDTAKLKLTAAKNKLKVKLLTQSAYSEIEETVNEANKNVTVAFLTYYSAIYKLNFDTSGGMESFVRKGILPWKSIHDGLAPINASPEQAKPLVGTYVIDYAVDPITSALSINIDPSLGATHYQLFTKENIPLTERIQAGKPIVALQLMLQSIADYQMIFFKQQAPVAQATFDGMGSSGSMSIESINTFDIQVLDNAAAKPSNELGTVIIGTFQIAISQLSKEIATAALATVAESGQGILFKPTHATNQWFDLENTLDYQDIIKGLKSATVHADQIKALHITVSIQSGGSIISLQSPEQVQSEVGKLTKSIDELQAQANKASESGQFIEFAQIMQEIDTSMSKKEFLESILLGDSKQIMNRLAEWGASQAGETPTPEDSSEIDKQTDKTNELIHQLTAAMEAGNSIEIEDIAIALVDALHDQLSVEQGVQQDIAALIEAQATLVAAYQTAKQTNDNDRMSMISEALSAIQLDIRIAMKQHTFTEKQAIEHVVALLAEQGQQTDQLLQLRSEAIQSIVEFEKMKYDEQELVQVEEQSAKIIEQFDGLIQPLPVQRVISSSFDIKLDLPPVFTDGQAMIQIRPISEAFGALVVWNDDDQTVTITKNGVVLISTVGNPVAYVDGQPFLMETYPRLVSGRVVVPLRFVAISLGIEVNWDSGTQTIELSNKGDIQQ
jgi:hypothetical protein